MKAIPYGVMNRLVKLTSSTHKNCDKRIGELYPEHSLALKKANLAPQIFPKMNTLLNHMTMDDENENKKKKKEKDRKRQKKANLFLYWC